MSQQSSDPADLFDDAGGGAVGFGSETQSFESTDHGGDFSAPPARKIVRQRGFDIYSFMLIVSFVMLTAASIMLFMDAANY